MTLPEEIAHAEAAYYQQLTDEDLTAEDFAAFVSHLPPKARLAVEVTGFESNRALLPFRRYVLEQRGLTMLAHLRDRLSGPAWAYCQTHH